MAAELLQILDIVLVSRNQQQVTLVRQVLQPAAVDELHHVGHCGEVKILRRFSNTELRLEYNITWMMISLFLFSLISCWNMAMNTALLALSTALWHLMVFLSHCRSI